MRLPANRRKRFPKSTRIGRSQDFDQIKRYGTRSQGEHLTIYHRKRQVAVAQSTLLRLAVVTSRRVGNAVVRNRWRRRVREFFRLEIFPELQGTAGSVVHEFVVIVRQQASPRTSYDVIKDELRVLLLFR